MFSKRRPVFDDSKTLFPCSLRQMRMMPWEKPSFIRDVRGYLQAKAINKEVYYSYLSQLRFKKKMQSFVEEEGVIIGLCYQYPSECLDENGHPMYEVELPLHLMVVESQEAKESIVIAAYKDPKYNAYYRLEGLYKRLALEYLNISRQDVQQALNQLQVYQKSKPFKPAIVKPIVSERAMKQWEIDLVDMTEYAAQNSNYKYLMNVIDTFSKFLWSYPIPNKESPTVVRHLEGILLREGAPKVISSDNGKEFKCH